MHVDAVSADTTLHLLTWDLGRAYYAYVGMVERILVEEKLDHLIQPGMGYLLFELFAEDDRTVKDLATRSQLAGSSLTRMLTRMEENGLVHRSRDPNDARLVRVRLTPTARKIEAKCRAGLQRIAEVAETGVGKQNVRRTKAYLRRLTTAFREEDRRLAEKKTSS